MAVRMRKMGGAVSVLLVAITPGCAPKRADQQPWESQARISRYFSELTDPERAAKADIEKMRRLIEKDWRDHQARMDEQAAELARQEGRTAAPADSGPG